MKKILVPVDFEPHALNALEYAKKLAKKIQCTLYVMHVYQTPITAPVNAFTSRDQTMQQISESMFKAAKTRLESLLSGMSYSQIKTASLVVEGDVDKEIFRVSEENDIDLVVMGYKGAQGVDGFLQKDIPKKVIQQSEKSVLVIPESFTFSPIEHVVYALDKDFFSEAEKILNSLMRFCKSQDASCTLLHVNHNKENTLSFEDIKNLSSLLRGNFEGTEYRSIINEHVLEGINEFLLLHTYQVLAMSTHVHGFWDDLTHHSKTLEMIRSKQVPVLVV